MSDEVKVVSITAKSEAAQAEATQEKIDDIVGHLEMLIEEAEAGNIEHLVAVMYTKNNDIMMSMSGVLDYMYETYHYMDNYAKADYNMFIENITGRHLEED